MNVSPTFKLEQSVIKLMYQKASVMRKLKVDQADGEIGEIK